ncbi:MAG: hypothetical protein IPK42_05640 [Betaproteobacteria bacterium]|nr:hypothetical protein [Betaproteobacteria bacterium]
MKVLTLKPSLLLSVAVLCPSAVLTSQWLEQAVEAELFPGENRPEPASSR